MIVVIFFITFQVQMRILGLLFLVILAPTLANASIRCTPAPLWSVPTKFDVIFYGGLEPDSFSALQEINRKERFGPYHDHLHKFHITEAFKGTPPGTKAIELWVRGSYNLRDQDFVVGARYQSDGLHYDDIRSKVCQPEKELLEFFRSLTYKSRSIILPFLGLILLTLTMGLRLRKKQKN